MSVRAGPNVMETDLPVAAADALTSNASKLDKLLFIWNTRYEIGGTHSPQSKSKQLIEFPFILVSLNNH